MTEKELRRLNRSDLLEMMLALSKENEQLREHVQRLQSQLDKRIIEVEEAGSLAEAVLRLNRVFEAAQAACDQYVQNVQARCERMEEETKVNCNRMIEEVKQKANAYEE